MFRSVQFWQSNEDSQPQVLSESDPLLFVRISKIQFDKTVPGKSK